MTPLSILDIQTEELAATLTAEEAAAAQAAAAALGGASTTGKAAPPATVPESAVSGAAAGQKVRRDKGSGEGAKGAQRQRRPRTAGADAGPDGAGRKSRPRRGSRPAAKKSATTGDGTAGQKLQRSRSRHQQRSRDGQNDAPAPAVAASPLQNDGQPGHRHAGRELQTRALPQHGLGHPQHGQHSGSSKDVNDQVAIGAEQRE